MKYLPMAVRSRLVSILSPGDGSGATDITKVAFGFAPADTNLPFCVVNVDPATDPDYQTDADAITETVPVLVNIYSSSAVDCFDKVKTVEQSFASTLLVLDFGKCLAVYMGGHTVDVDPDREADGKEVYHGILIMEFLVQRSLKSTT